MRAFAISPGAGHDLGRWVEALPVHATDVVLREPSRSPDAIHQAAQRVLETNRALWIHERCAAAPRLAAELRCGLHLRAAGPPTTRLHGRSCHSARELDAAFGGGAMYAFLSPVFRPTSKPEDERSPLGIARFMAMADGRAVAALGGVTPEHEAMLERAGAWAVAVLGAWARGSSGARVEVEQTKTGLGALDSAD